MPLDLHAFNNAFLRARDRIREQGADIAAEQEKLRALVPDDASADDLAFALGMAEDLAKPEPPPRQWSALYHEAGQIHADSYPVDGTTEEKIAALEEARRKIWAIADRAAPDEAPHIRAMTRVLEHIENELRDPTFPLDGYQPPTD
ncbi:hypothetical protein [Kribbella sp. NPDC051718]|uniref:hypothetical protein n=1 Tax=Kribbella sp. NPDC051718 TaxID=3155168 RepID=UPI003445FDA7